MAGASIGDISSVNVTGLDAGHVEQSKRQMNVIPTTARVYLDFRVGLDVSFDHFIEHVILASSDEDFLTWKLVNKPSDPNLIFVKEVNCTTVGDDWWWNKALKPALQEWTSERKITYKTEMFRGATGMYNNLAIII